MASPQGDPAGSGRVSGRAIIVHPNFQHTLPARRVSPLPARWQNLPLDVLHRVAARLASARDLCSFERICRSSRCGAARAPTPVGARAGNCGLPCIAPPAACSGAGERQARRRAPPQRCEACKRAADRAKRPRPT